MSWRMLGRPFSTADMVGTPTISQKMTLSSGNYLISAQAAIIFYNDPIFTNISAEIWSDRSGSPQIFIGSSNVITKSRILETYDNAIKIIGFEFTSAIPVHAGAFHVCIRANGYTGDDSSHIAWRHSYPDPQYIYNVTADAAHADNHPFDLIIIGSDE